jgi:type VI secretion system secreted protein Hcp
MRTALLLRGSALALAATLAAAPTTAQTLDHFLQIGSIKGESLDAKHRNWIDLAGWSWGVHQQTDAFGKTTAAFDPFSWQQGLDSAVVPLFLATANQQSFATATLDVTRLQSGVSQVFFQMIFSQARPSELNIVSASEVQAALRYDAVTMRYSADGKSWIEGSFSAGAGGLSFSGDANVLTGLMASGGRVTLAGLPPPPVPEPSTWALFAGGLLLTALRLRRRAVPTP